MHQKITNTIVYQLQKYKIHHNIHITPSKPNHRYSNLPFFILPPFHLAHPPFLLRGLGVRSYSRHRLQRGHTICAFATHYISSHQQNMITSPLSTSHIPLSFGEELGVRSYSRHRLQRGRTTYSFATHYISSPSPFTSKRVSGRGHSFPHNSPPCTFPFPSERG